MLKQFNMDFQKKIVIETGKQSWLDSPVKGIKRIPLEREDLESGHTTSIVTYAPNSKFSEHSHPFGEEIFVLEGVFSDENGNHPAGSYLRNPPGSVHAPFSEMGCKIFVKLNQFSPEDHKEVVVNTNDNFWMKGYGNLMVYPLHQFGTESVALVRWPAGERFIPHSHFGGEEIFVLKGEFIDEFGRYPKGTWIRSPHLSSHHPFVEEETIIFVKTGHF